MQSGSSPDGDPMNHPMQALRVSLFALLLLTACSSSRLLLQAPDAAGAVTVECQSSSSGICHLLMQPRPQAALVRMDIPANTSAQITNVDRGAPLCHSANAAIDWTSCQKTTIGQTVIRNGALVVWP